MDVEVLRQVAQRIHQIFPGVVVAVGDCVAESEVCDHFLTPQRSTGTEVRPKVAFVSRKMVGRWYGGIIDVDDLVKFIELGVMEQRRDAKNAKNGKDEL